MEIKSNIKIATLRFLLVLKKLGNIFALRYVALKVYRYRYRHRGKSLFTYRLLTELKIPLPYISGRDWGLFHGTER